MNGMKDASILIPLYLNMLEYFTSCKSVSCAFGVPTWSDDAIRLTGNSHQKQFWDETAGLLKFSPKQIMFYNQ
jgi:hypothetical protein